MQLHTEQTSDSRSSVPHSGQVAAIGSQGTFAFNDQRPEAATQRKLVNLMHSGAPVVQLQRIESRGIDGLTHLVEMTDEGSLYNGADWYQNEREEVGTEDLLEVDLDDFCYSRRGIDQEHNWQVDGASDTRYLWIRVVSLNHREFTSRRYVRAEMLGSGYRAVPKNMHSIWVQGNYMSNPEAVEGLKTRESSGSHGWVNMIWLYASFEDDGHAAQDRVELDHGRFMRIHERSFVDEMAAWKRSGRMPLWVQRWLPILDVLYEKKSYVTMSDIMRMIILYYEGGLYLDVKIKVDAETQLGPTPMIQINTANFFDRENWAILASVGCRMIEAIMVETLDQFPDPEELRGYSENYNDPAGRGREGRSHVTLHESLGPWNRIERGYRQHDYDRQFLLTNPRPVNSWSDNYDDRDPSVILAEQRRDMERELRTKTLLLEQKNRELERLKERQRMERPGSQAANELTETISTLDTEIHSLELRTMILEQELKAPSDDDGSPGIGLDPEMEARFRALGIL